MNYDFYLKEDPRGNGQYLYLGKRTYLSDEGGFIAAGGNMKN